MMLVSIRIALVVGSILFAINHGAALFTGKMTRARWLSAGLTYLTPYAVSIYGQSLCRAQKRLPNHDA
ncbi:MAG: hypothetical protein F6K19_24450 [Cyanothece sp. SIO1E1]|nr:hypothetical protein [Cyanothece sp. SIO1E1]